MGLVDLVEDYVISLELGEHRKVSKLSPEICAELIEILDDYLAERDDDEDADIGLDDSQLIQTIGSICDRIRRFDDIAVAYHEVRSFVYLYVSIPLSNTIISNRDSV